MLVGICDFPGSYSFPPLGYGGIERWLWATALGARAAGADVHLLGPRWRNELAQDWVISPLRLEDIAPDSVAEKELQKNGYDLLVVGHEYPSLPAWRRTADVLGCDVATFQHAPAFTHTPETFDGHKRRLYCYAPEMMERYSAHHPVQELAVHSGLGEEEPSSTAGNILVWVGRIDAEKSPHLAVRAAQVLGRRIRLVGPVFDEAYVRRHEALFSASHVEWAGELGGSAKTGAIRDAAVLVYTCARDYVEAGAAIFGEALRAGTPVAALAWRTGTCAEAALCERTGASAIVDPADEDEAAARALAEAVTRADDRRHAEVQQVGRDRFDPKRHFESLSARR